MVLSLTRSTDPPRYFESWREYLLSWRGESDATFCRALTANYEPLLGPEWLKMIEEIDKYQEEVVRDTVLNQALQDAEEELKRLGRRVAFPWVTPVLGSGCLSVAEGPEAHSIARVPGQVAALTSGWGELPDGNLISRATSEFADKLIATKLVLDGTPDVTSVPLDTPPLVDRTICAHALLSAHLLSRLYFEIGALNAAPVGPSSTPLEFDTRSDRPTPRGARIDDALRRPLIDSLRELQLAVGHRPGIELSFVAKFANAVRDDLTAEPRRVRGSDAALMSEIAWHFMTEGTSQYPGWSDLLVLLNFAFNSADRTHRWPHLTDLTSARETLALELRDTTDLSWRSRLGPASAEPSQRNQLYDVIAHLLVAQARLSATDSLDGRSSANGGTARASYHTEAYPPAVAFVTSFDLELEMALLAARTSFRLIMPFYVQRIGTHSAVGYVWLQTIIEPSVRSELGPEDLAPLYRPAEWTLLSTHPSRHDERPGLPAVVRLAGSPLVEGPDLVNDDGPWVDSLKVQIGSNTTLVGTVLLDEHTALQQWAAEFGTSRRPTTELERLGLPERFVSGINADTDARFWFLLGVQLRDDGIRHRSAALVGAAALRSGVTARPRTNQPRRAGVIVNRRTTPNQRDVFLWQGLDVVAATYQDVLPALRHAGDHAAHPDLRRISGNACALPETLA